MSGRLFQFYWGRMAFIKKPWPQYKCNALIETGIEHRTHKPNIVYPNCTSCRNIIMIIAGKANRFHGFYYIFHLGHFKCQKPRPNKKLWHLLRHLSVLRRLLDDFFIMHIQYSQENIKICFPRGHKDGVHRCTKSHLSKFAVIMMHIS